LIVSLDAYYLLGRSGLRVSRLALGTMNFGTSGFHAPYGKSEDDSRAIFRRYVEAGGNFIDTADFYTAGESETLLGRFIADAGIRERIVLTTKFTNSVEPGNPNGGGNGRKHVMRAVEDSLRRLGTDYIDLYLLHTWDRMTPVEEVVRTLDDLVRSGKVRYTGLSDVPAWYAARAQTYAEAHGMSPIITVQLPYSLLARGIEPEFVPMAQALGIGITGFVPVASGLLSGKYRQDGSGEGRLSLGAPGSGGPRDDREWGVIAALEEVAKELGRGMAQVAINWVANRPGVGATIIGASSSAQIEGNLAALDFEISAKARQRLEEASAVPLPSHYSMFTPEYQSWLVHPGVGLGDKPAGYAPPIWHGQRQSVG
jgi:aryl-alcohol dehydrogenase-like predicted oxidoreductase